MRIRWTEAAVGDLKSICDYVAERDGDDQARRIAFRIYELLNSLTDFLRRGRKPGTRDFVFQGLPWLAVYRIRDEAVEIDRILHGAQRFP